MLIELIKEYKFGAKKKPVGTQAEVTNALGSELINKKIAKELEKKVTDIETILKKELGKKTNKEEKNVILQHNESGEAPDTNDK